MRNQWRQEAHGKPQVASRGLAAPRETQDLRREIQAAGHATQIEICKPWDAWSVPPAGKRNRRFALTNWVSGKGHFTMVENEKKRNKQNSHFPTSEEVSERANEWAQWRARAKQAVRSKQTSGVSERANGRASGPVLQCVFLVVPAHSAPLLHFLLPPLLQFLFLLFHLLHLLLVRGWKLSLGFPSLI